MPARATPAVSAAQRAGIIYRVHDYAHDPRAESFGQEAAAALGLPPARVFKTLVASVAGQHVVAVVPVSTRLNLKLLAEACGAKHTEMAEPAAAGRATGYVVGGISPLGTRKRLPVLLDDSALGFETIFISAGRRGLELELSPHDLLRLTGGRSTPLATG